MLSEILPITIYMPLRGYVAPSMIVVRSQRLAARTVSSGIVIRDARAQNHRDSARDRDRNRLTKAAKALVPFATRLPPVSLSLSLSLSISLRSRSLFCLLFDLPLLQAANLKIHFALHTYIRPHTHARTRSYTQGAARDNDNAGIEISYHPFNHVGCLSRREQNFQRWQNESRNRGNDSSTIRELRSVMTSITKRKIVLWTRFSFPPQRESPVATSSAHPMAYQRTGNGGRENFAAPGSSK